MSAWKTIIQHEFPDKNLENFNAMEGVLELSSQAPKIETTLSGANTLFLLQHDTWMKYIPAIEMNDVIGIQIKCKVRVPHHNSNRNMDMFDLGHFKIRMVLHSHNTGKSLEVRYGTQLATIVNYPADDSNFFDLEVLWQTNGQLRILINSRLELFRNDFGANTKTTIAKACVGINEDFAGPVAHSSFFLSYLNIKALRESDAASEVLKHFHVRCPPPIPKICLGRMLDRQQKIVTVLRKFMFEFSQKHTRNWDEMNDNGQPMSGVAKNAHAKAVKCGTALKKAFEKPSSATAKEFYVALEDFMLYLKQHNSESYTQMLNEAIELTKPDPQCEDYKSALYAQLDAATKYKLGLFEESMKIITSTN